MLSKIFFIFVIAAFVLAVVGCEQKQEQEDSRAKDKAIENTVRKAVDALAQQQVPNIKRIAIGPIKGTQSESFKEYLQALGTKGPYEIYVRSDNEWDMLLKEIAWGSRKEDIMDAETIQKFGRIQGVEAFLYGTVKDLTVSDFNVNSKLLLNLAVVETGQTAWGDTFTDTQQRNIYEVSKQYWRYAGYAVVGLIILAIFIGFLRRLSTPR